MIQETLQKTPGVGQSNHNKPDRTGDPLSPPLSTMRDKTDKTCGSRATRVRSGCMALYGRRPGDWGVGSLAAKVGLILTFPQQAGCNQHVGVADLSVFGTPTVGIVHANPKSHLTRSELQAGGGREEGYTHP